MSEIHRVKRCNGHSTDAGYTLRIPSQNLDLEYALRNSSWVSEHTLVLSHTVNGPKSIKNTASQYCRNPQESPYYIHDSVTVMNQVVLPYETVHLAQSWRRNEKKIRLLQATMR